MTDPIDFAAAERHPAYGPCDGFGPGGECSQCTGIIEMEPEAMPRRTIRERMAALGFVNPDFDESVREMLAAMEASHGA